MLKQNIPLSITLLRIMFFLIISYSILYGLAQWLQASGHYSAHIAGLVTLPMSIVAGISSLLATKIKHLRASFIFAALFAVIGCIGLMMMNSQSSLWWISIVTMCFGIPLGMVSTTTQIALQAQTPTHAIGIASGLQRTFGYIGAIFAASLLAISYGQQATDAGFHTLVLVMAAISIFLLLFTCFDPSLTERKSSSLS